MASKVTNDRKRSEMATIMESILGEKGWKPAEIAAVVGCTPSNISSWKSGKNMGTNAQRTLLKGFPERSSDLAKKLMEAAVANAQHHVDAASTHLTEIQNDYDGFLKSAVESRDHGIKYHSKELADASEKAGKAHLAAGARLNAMTTGNKDFRHWEQGYLIDLIDYISKKQYDNNTKTGYEYDMEYHTKSLAEDTNTTPDMLAATAKSNQDNAIKYDEKLLAKAVKHLKNMEKVLAKW